MSCRSCVLSSDLQLQNLKTIRNSKGLVVQILRGEWPLLDPDQASINAEIIQLEQLLSSYDAQFQEIQLRRCAVLVTLENRKSIYAPIRRLPRDVLTEIFHFVCTFWWPKAKEDYILASEFHGDGLDVSRLLWVLGRVCGLWRKTLHLSPASWAQKIIVKAPFSKHAPDILQTYLDNTGEHLLNLRVFLPSNKPSKIGEIMSLLIQSCQRWKNLILYIHTHYLHYLESISRLPVLQTIEIDILGLPRRDYRTNILLNAPQLWQGTFRTEGIHQIGLPSGITHYSGCITCSEDLQLLSQLPKLMTCHLRYLSVPEEMPMVITQLRHLHVDYVDILNFLIAPLLNSLAINGIPQRASSRTECLVHFLDRSRCRRQSLTIGSKAITASQQLSSTIRQILSSEACSTLSRLKFELGSRLNDASRTFEPSLVIPNLSYLALCISRPSKDLSSVSSDLLPRCDVGWLKEIEVQFQDKEYEDILIADIRALCGGDWDMRVEEWDPLCRDHLLLSWG
ncbi:uncharacterized protein EV420DRAFT_914055 [Desarmillaria tabescens]|uniref:F-box domain-containing protein n=1 Tax=Armillaria tabescens TaxID=1929756 RepID=A0AA39JNJ8_ARMTA|nr:uncharacterized protein EV420DRAFT_914055 [Desarmillaria tabescens]KAK0446035.1 hypothetical protein EV420DRAFT_914055 [Desarmillaria tabescens]